MATLLIVFPSLQLGEDWIGLKLSLFSPMYIAFHFFYGEISCLTDLLKFGPGFLM